MNEKVAIKPTATPVIGIPDPAAYGDPSKLPINEELPYVVQAHQAVKAGPHYDVRFGKDRMFSWSTKKEMPSPGEARRWFQQPLHEEGYKDFQGEIASGYGMGTVKTHDKGSVIVTEASVDKVSFITGHGRSPRRFTMMRGEKPKEWLVVNTTPRNLGALMELPPDELQKEHYKPIAQDAIKDLYSPANVFSEKIDGASAYFKIKKDRVEATSIRLDKDGRPIMYTEKLQMPRGLQVPKHLVGSVVQGEVYGERERQMSGKRASIPDKIWLQRDELLSQKDTIICNKTASTDDTEVIPPQELGGLLNASLAESLRRQREQRIRLRAALFNIKRYGGRSVSPEVPYAERQKMLQEIASILPPEKFHLPATASTPEEQRAMWEQISGGQNPRTTEGVVIMTPKGPAKVVIRPESDVYIREIYPSTNPSMGAGGFKYSLTPEGPIVGNVGTGLDLDTRFQLTSNPREFIGRRARIESRGMFPSGAHRAPSFIAVHEDYPSVTSNPDKNVGIMSGLGKMADLTQQQQRELIATQQEIFDKLKPLLPPGVEHGSGAFPDVNGISDVDVSLFNEDPKSVEPLLPKGTQAWHMDDHSLYAISGYDRPVNLYVGKDKAVVNRAPTHRAVELKLQEMYPELAAKALELKRQGMKTEPAWGQVLNIQGDPYQEMLDEQKVLAAAQNYSMAEKPWSQEKAVELYTNPVVSPSLDTTQETTQETTQVKKAAWSQAAEKEKIDSLDKSGIIQT